MCIICRKEYNDDTTKLDISKCKDIQEIPVLPRLETLLCDNCPELQKIPILPLLKGINCSWCANLTEIPVLPRLETLHCYGCENLQEIPIQLLLKELNCSFCHVKEIPVLPKLETLNCSWCTKLQEISDLPKLQKLHCEDCPNLILQPNKPQVYRHIGCRWLQQKNVNRIVLLQRFLLSYLRYRKFSTYIRKEKYSAWLYTPDGPLGWKCIQRLQNIVFRKPQ